VRQRLLVGRPEEKYPYGYFPPAPKVSPGCLETFPGRRFTVSKRHLTLMYTGTDRPRTALTEVSRLNTGSVADWTFGHAGR
jgi:hypothetical protein